MDKRRAIDMSRTEWNKDASFDDAAKALCLTVLITQSHSKNLVRLTLESFLRFYPDIPVLVVDNLGRDYESFVDDSSQYLDWKAITNHNVRVWHRVGINSHGISMDEAIRQHITTKYVLLLDSDTITERGGWIEPMLSEFKSNPRLFGIGAYMPVSFSNYACGGPYSESDILHYAHPQCSIYDRDIYLTLAPFTDHGAPCCYTCREAQAQHYDVVSWPIDLYVSHLAGASWTTPRTVWQNDHNVFLRPFVTFLTSDQNIINELQAQTDKDFDIVVIDPMQEHFFCVIPIQGKATPKYIKNDSFLAFYKVTGEYVCIINGSIYPGYVADLKIRAIQTNGANTINIGGAVSYRRNYWQEYVCLNG